MREDVSYTGIVEINFLNEYKEIIGTSTTHNEGTPNLFQVICNILKNGTSSINDDRPGKIMLFSKPATQEEEDTPLLSYPSTLQSARVGRDNDLESWYIEYSFLISSYQLQNQPSLSDLTGYRLVLLKANYNGWVSEKKLEDPSVLAIASIPEMGDDSNYSLLEGTYINILWRLYFNNNNANSTESGSSNSPQENEGSEEQTESESE